MADYNKSFTKAAKDVTLKEVIFAGSNCREFWVILRKLIPVTFVDEINSRKYFAKYLFTEINFREIF